VTGTPWRRRLRYEFDHVMARGPVAAVAILLAAALLFMLGTAVVVLLAGITPEGESAAPFFETFWRSVMRTIDPGAMGGDAGWGFRLSSLFITLGGIFLLSTLIGLITSGIEARVETLRKGRSAVLEQDHTLILGWSPQVFTIIAELVIANANRARPVIVVLADVDKVEMEDAIRARVPRPGRTRIVCRTGSPIDVTDLAIVSPQTARSIIVPAPAVEDPDAQVIKTLLALTHSPGRRRGPYHVVADMRRESNVEVARMVGRDDVHIVVAGDLISRIAVQTCRQSGLSVVYTELLDFDGDEIYFADEPGLAGRTFGEALLCYEDSALIGLRSSDGRVRLLPPMHTPIAPGDRMIAISADDDTVRLATTEPTIDAHAIREAIARLPVPERTLILGWNQRAPAIIGELDAYVAPGSTVTLVAEEPGIEAAIAARATALRHQQVTLTRGDTTDRRQLEALAIQTFDHVIVLGCSDRLGPQEADARTLVTLLHLRDISERSGRSVPIVSEMLDVRNRELAEVTRADDFIVSDRLVSLLLAQVSENREVAEVFANLFSPEGAELYLKPAGDYVPTGVPVTFYTVVESARRRGEVAIGYRLKAESGDADRARGVHLNPRKGERVAFTDADRIIVLAED